MENVGNISAVAVIVGLTQVIKQLGLSSRLIPLISIFIGVGIAYLIAGMNFNQQVAFEGLFYGLSACGLWSGTKAVAGQ